MEPENIRKFLRHYVPWGIFLFLILRYFEKVLSFAGRIWNVAFPLLLGCVLAYILNIIMQRLEKYYFPKSQKKLVNKTRRPVCMAGSLFLIVAIFFLVINLVLPQLINSLIFFGKSIPDAADKTGKWMTEHLNGDVYHQIMDNTNLDWNSMLQKISSYLTGLINSAMNSAVLILSYIGNGLMNLLMGIIFAFYILMNKEKLQRNLKRLLLFFFRHKNSSVFFYVLDVLNDTFSKFIVGQCTEAVILGTLCALGMLLFRFPYAVMVGVLVGCTALIPVLGAYIGAAVGAFMILTVSPVKALAFVLYLVILQQLEGNLIYPKVVGSSIGLPGIWVFVAVTVGGGLCGILGMLLGVPLSAAFYKILTVEIRRSES